MIEYIKGKLDDVTPTLAVVDCNGVGYGINISLNTFSAIQGKPEVKLYVYEAIREDAYVLYGFATKQERELFLMLITVSGIGGNTARMILSALSPSELCNVIIKNTRSVHNVSTLLTDYCGISDVCISVPTVLGINGAEEYIPYDYTEEELGKLRSSAKKMREFLDSLNV